MKSYSTQDSRHLNMTCYKLENKYLIVKILRDFGAKIVSLYDKESDYEFLFQPTKGKYYIPDKNSPFENYDTSGIDECFPTIDESVYLDTDIILPDHGEIWSKKWQTEIASDSIISTTKSDILGIDFTRKINLISDKINFSYIIKNTTSEKRYYLYAFHSLMNFNDFTRMEFDFDYEIVNVKSDEKYNFDYRNLSEYEDKKSYKFYFKDEITNPRYRIIQEDKNTSLEISYDSNINKYLGVWVSKGGFKNEYNFAIEPCSGYFDSLEKAYKNNKISSLLPYEEVRWDMEIKLTKIR